MDTEGTAPLFPERLAAGFERWTVTVGAGSDRPTCPDEWADALVVVEQGPVEIICRGGARRTFGRGSFLSLSWLPVTCLRNSGTDDVVLFAYRRVGPVDGR